MKDGEYDLYNSDTAQSNSLLIVDDDKSNLMILIDILQPDYTVFTAKDGEEAVKKAQKYSPDLILLDIILPGIDGYETLTRLRELDETKKIPVVFITGLSESGSEEKGLALGAADYITKPFNPVIVKLKVIHQIKIINLQRALAAAMEKAENASEAKTRFVANMSHEMRTPMNAIVGLTGLMLEDDDIPGKTKETLEKINTAGNTLLGLINDVLDISKIEAGKLDLVPVQYDVADLLNEIIALNIVRIGEKSIIFKLDINEDMPCQLFGDDLRIKQILNNMLSNAFKYTEAGTVTLGVTATGDSTTTGGITCSGVWVTFYVRDTGIGIRGEDLTRLFADYNQVDTKANRKIEGTGLGLSITKKFVEMMDGEITVESEYGKGSTFFVRICQGFVTEEHISGETLENLRRLHYSKKKQAQEKLVRSDLSYARVLVADDFPTNLDVSSGMLRKYKMQVDCVSNGREAVDRIAAGVPVYDAVFMDHMMPEMDGMEATALIRGLGTPYAQNIPIIALTANAVAGNEQMFLENGFNAFLPKPFNVMLLDSIIQRWVRDKSKE
ncbi:MAG: response regulator [Treponema sp.]|jgi:signal transduction histidine kinase|nr:response regulator [Treponema sp.]